MNNTPAYYPFNTTIQFPVKPTSLSRVFKAALLEQSEVWREGTKLKRGAIVSFREGTTEVSTKLEHSVIKIEGVLYALHRQEVARGGQGRIKVLERFDDSVLYLVKISNIPSALDEGGFDIIDDVTNEIEVLLDAGLCRGQAQRILPSQDFILDYTVKSYIVMTNLGRDLKKHLIQQHQERGLITHEVRFDIAIKALWELAQFHLGLLFISGCGRMHRDLKPANMVLNDDGVRLIDFGLSEKNPHALVTPNMGTIPYCEIPFKDFMKKRYEEEYKYVCPHGFQYFYRAYQHQFRAVFFQEHDEKRSGIFFDMEAMRRSLYGPLCKNPRRTTKLPQGILSQNLVITYNLEQYLDRAYLPDKTEYIKEDQLMISDAMTLTAVFISAQVKLEHHKINRIMREPDLAACVVGTYFSNQMDWIAHGYHTLNLLMDLRVNDLKYRAKFVRLGLSHDLNEGLKDDLLRHVIDSNSSHDMKRAAICLFHRGLWNKAVYQRLKASPDVPLACLKAYYNHDEEALNRLFFRSDNFQNSASPYVYQSLNAHDEIMALLKGFPLTADNIEAIEKNNDVITWFFRAMHDIRSLEIGYERACLNNAARIYAFLVHPVYQEAVLIAYHSFISGMKTEGNSLRTALINATNLDVAHMMVGLSSLLSIEALYRFSELNVWIASAMLLKKHPKLTMLDFSCLLADGVQTTVLIQVLLEIKEDISRVALDNLIALQKNNQVLFNLLIDQEGKFNYLPRTSSLVTLQNSKQVVNFIISHRAIGSYFFEAGFEEAKIDMITLFLFLSKSTMAQIRIEDNIFLKAAVILSRAHVLNKTNLVLLSRNHALCLELSKESSTIFLDVAYIQWKLICGSANVNACGLENHYPHLRVLIMSIDKFVKTPKDRQQSCESLIKLYKALDVIKTALSRQEMLVNNTSFVERRFTDVWQKIEQIMASYQDVTVATDTRKEALFFNSMKQILDELESFATDPRCIIALKKNTVKNSEVSYGRWSLFFCMGYQEKTLSAYLHDMTIAIGELNECLYLVTAPPRALCCSG